MISVDMFKLFLPSTPSRGIWSRQNVTLAVAPFTSVRWMVYMSPILSCENQISQLLWYGIFLIHFPSPPFQWYQIFLHTDVRRPWIEVRALCASFPISMNDRIGSCRSRWYTEISSIRSAAMYYKMSYILHNCICDCICSVIMIYVEIFICQYLYTWSTRVSRLNGMMWRMLSFHTKFSICTFWRGSRIVYACSPCAKTRMWLLSSATIS